MAVRGRSRDARGPGSMVRDEVWDAIDAQRHDITELLGRLTDDQWRHRSLCEGWTVRDVAAHLTLQQVGFGAAVSMMVRARGDIDRAVHAAARRRASVLSTQQIIAEIRGTIGSRRHNAGVTCRETLIDILVHGQDIAIPLGLAHRMPTDAAAAAADRVWTMHWPPPFPATRRLRGLQITATDVEWSVGQGPRISAPIGAILLLSTGRLAALEQFSGPGAAELAVRLTAPSRR